jgi:arylsulfatase A-like enzyme
MKLGGRRVSSPVGLMDIMPTVLDTAGIRPAAGLHGISLLPFLGGTRDPRLEDRVIVSELMDHHLALRRGRYSYILDRRAGTEMLFDLDKDPTEKIDLARKMPDLLASFQKEKNDFDAARGIFAKGRKQSDAVALDAKEVERLRALGYIK